MLRARPKANVNLFLQDMNGAVAAAGGDMAKAALAGGLVDRIGDQQAFEARLAQLGGESRSEPGGYNRIKLASYIADKVEQAPKGPIGVVTIAGMIVDGKAGPGTAGGDTIANAIEDGSRQGHQGAGRAGRQPRRLGPRLGAHPPGAARGQGAQDPDRRLDGQRRRLGRLLGRDAGRLHLRRAVDDHRVDRGVRRAAELPGHA